MTSFQSVLLGLYLNLKQNSWNQKKRSSCWRIVFLMDETPALRESLISIHGCFLYFWHPKKKKKNIAASFVEKIGRLPDSRMRTSIIPKVESRNASDATWAQIGLSSCTKYLTDPRKNADATKVSPADPFKSLRLVLGDHHSFTLKKLPFKSSWWHPGPPSTLVPPKLGQRCSVSQKCMSTPSSSCVSSTAGGGCPERPDVMSYPWSSK